MLEPRRASRFVDRTHSTYFRRTFSDPYPTSCSRKLVSIIAIARPADRDRGLNAITWTTRKDEEQEGGERAKEESRARAGAGGKWVCLLARRPPEGRGEKTRRPGRIRMRRGTARRDFYQERASRCGNALSRVALTAAKLRLRRPRSRPLVY